MRNIAEIIKDDKNGKHLSQTERQIAVAYVQGKYDAVRELKICNNSNAMEVIDKIRAEIMQLDYDIESVNYDYGDMAQAEDVHMICREEVLRMLDKYKAESEDEE